MRATLIAAVLIALSTVASAQVRILQTNSSKKVSLAVGTLSNATSLEKLVVGRWDIPAGNWKNEGNTSFSGISIGTITSEEVTSFSIFTLASTVEQENPLPSQPIVLKASRQDRIISLTWRIEALSNAELFEVLRSDDNTRFIAVQKIPAVKGRTEYDCRDPVSGSGIYYYKIRMTQKDGTVFDSGVRPVIQVGGNLQLVMTQPVVRGTTINMTITAAQKTSLTIGVMGADGRLVRQISATADDTTNRLSMEVPFLPSGIYYVTWYAAGMKAGSVRFIKL